MPASSLGPTSPMAASLNSIAMAPWMPPTSSTTSRAEEEDDIRNQFGGTIGGPVPLLKAGRDEDLLLRGLQRHDHPPGNHFRSNRAHPQHAAEQFHRPVGPRPLSGGTRTDRAERRSRWAPSWTRLPRGWFPMALSIPSRDELSPVLSVPEVRGSAIPLIPRVTTQPPA